MFHREFSLVCSLINYFNKLEVMMASKTTHWKKCPFFEKSVPSQDSLVYADEAFRSYIMFEVFLYQGISK